MRKTRVKSKDALQWVAKYTSQLSKKDKIELLEDKQKLLIINDVPAFFCYGEQWLPTLRYLQHYAVLKKIVVDMGAIKFVINGADIMRPGVTAINDGVSKGECIVVVDENNGKPLAVGEALFSSDEMKSMKAGKVIKNIHYVGDELWKYGTN
jgi:PUA-domain protein